jgi:hypothetical protein
MKDLVVYRGVITSGAVMSIAWVVFIGLPVIVFLAAGLLLLLAFNALPWMKSGARSRPRLVRVTRGVDVRPLLPTPPSCVTPTTGPKPRV